MFQRTRYQWTQQDKPGHPIRLQKIAKWLLDHCAPTARGVAQQNLFILKDENAGVKDIEVLFCGCKVDEIAGRDEMPDLRQHALWKDAKANVFFQQSVYHIQPPSLFHAYVSACQVAYEPYSFVVQPPIRRVVIPRRPT